MPCAQRPASRLLRRCAALAVVSTALLAPTASLASIDVEALRCPERERIATALDGLLPPLARGDDLALTLEHVDASRVRIRLMRRGEVFERTLPLRIDDCAELPQAAQLIVRAWLDQPWRELPRTLPDSPAETGPRRRPIATDLADTRAAPERAPGWLSLALAAGASAAVDASAPAASGAVTVGLELDARWGVALAGALDARTTTQVGDGVVAIRIAGLSALLRRRILDASGGRLDVLAGPGLQRVSAESEGFDTNLRGARLDIAVSALIRGEVPLLPRVALTASVGVCLRAHKEVFFVLPENLGVAVQPARAFINVGLSWDAVKAL